MADNVILQSDGRVALKLPDNFGQRIFWMQSISDSTVEPQLSDDYTDPQTGEIHNKVAALRRANVDVMAPYDDASIYPLLRLLENSNKDELQRLNIELTERIGPSRTVVYNNVFYQSHSRTGTDLLSNSARMLTITFSYSSQTV